MEVAVVEHHPVEIAMSVPIEGVPRANVEEGNGKVFAVEIVHEVRGVYRVRHTTEFRSAQRNSNFFN